MYGSQRLKYAFLLSSEEYPSILLDFLINQLISLHAIETFNLGFFQNNQNCNSEIDFFRKNSVLKVTQFSLK